jgi:hypothetical protein
MNNLGNSSPMQGSPSASYKSNKKLQIFFKDKEKTSKKFKAVLAFTGISFLDLNLLELQLFFSLWLISFLYKFAYLILNRIT